MEISCFPFVSYLLQQIEINSELKSFHFGFLRNFLSSTVLVWPSFVVGGATKAEKVCRFIPQKETIKKGYPEP